MRDRRRRWRWRGGGALAVDFTFFGGAEEGGLVGLGWGGGVHPSVWLGGSEGVVLCGVVWQKDRMGWDGRERPR